MQPQVPGIKSQAPNQQAINIYIAECPTCIGSSIYFSIRVGRPSLINCFSDVWNN